MRGLTLRLLLALCLLASTAQGFVAQTHVHVPRAPAAVAGIAGAVVDVLPAADPACVLCDIAGHSPAGAPPVDARAAVLPAAAQGAPPHAFAFVFLTAASHHWRGRAPPTV